MQLNRRAANLCQLLVRDNAMLRADVHELEGGGTVSLIWESPSKGVGRPG